MKVNNKEEKEGEEQKVCGEFTFLFFFFVTLCIRITVCVCVCVHFLFHVLMNLKGKSVELHKVI